MTGVAAEDLADTLWQIAQDEYEPLTLRRGGSLIDYVEPPDEPSARFAAMVAQTHPDFWFADNEGIRWHVIDGEIVGRLDIYEDEFLRPV